MRGMLRCALAVGCVAVLSQPWGCSEPAKIDLGAIKAAAKPSQPADGGRGLKIISGALKPPQAKAALVAWAAQGGKLPPRGCKDPLPIAKLNTLVQAALSVEPVEKPIGDAVALLAERLRTDGITMTEVLASAAIGARLRKTGYTTDIWKPGPEDDRRLIAVSGVCLVEIAQMAKSGSEAEQFVGTLWEGALQKNGGDLQSFVDAKVKDAKGSSSKFLAARTPDLGAALKQMQRLRGG